MLEHAPNLSVRFICDRGITHELVRHRLFSFAQESTRYVNYNKGEMQFIIPEWITGSMRDIMLNEVWNMDSMRTGGNINLLPSPESIYVSHCILTENAYNMLTNSGWVAQQSRDVLSNSIKSEIVVTGNVREWRNFFKLRLSPAAHPQMRELTIPLFKNLNADIPEIWKDIADRFSIK